MGTLNEAKLIPIVSNLWPSIAFSDQPNPNWRSLWEFSDGSVLVINEKEQSLIRVFLN